MIPYQEPEKWCWIDTFQVATWTLGVWSGDVAARQTGATPGTELSTRSLQNRKPNA